VRGAFITIEGIEGVGKSTNLAFVERLLKASGKDVLLTREPGGTPLGEQIRDWVLSAERGSLSAQVETLLMFAARAHHLAEVIRPALDAGRWIVCDRFTDATAAYQGGGRGADPALIDGLIAAVQRDLEPDLTLLLDAPLDVSLARITARVPDHFEKEDREFFERVRGAYLELARAQPRRIRVIDAAQPLEAVQDSIRTEVQAFAREFAR
jgi:dTMP kinase